MIDTETGGRYPSLDFIHDLASVTFDTNTGLILNSDLYKLVTREEQEQSTIIQNNLNVAKYAEFNDQALTGIRPASKSYGEFGAEILKKTFLANQDETKVAWIKNINFESKFFAPIINSMSDKDKNAFFDNLAGYSSYEKDLGRIGVTDFHIRTLKNQAALAIQDKDYNIARTLYSQIAARSYKYTNNNIPFSAGKTHILDLDDALRGMIAVAQEKGVMAKSKDLFTGTASEYIAAAFGYPEFKHEALDDALKQSEFLTSTFKKTYSALESAASLEDLEKSFPESFKGLKKLDTLIQSAGKKFSSAANYINVMSDLAVNKYTNQLGEKLEYKAGLDTFYTENDAVQYNPLIKQKKPGYFPQDVTKYFREYQDLDQSILDEDTIRSIENITQDAIDNKIDPDIAAKKFNDLSDYIRNAKQAAIKNANYSSTEAKAAIETALGTASKQSQKSLSSLKVFGIAAGALIGANIFFSDGQKKSGEKINSAKYYKRQNNLVLNKLGITEEERKENRDALAAKALSRVHILDSMPIQHFRY